MASRHADVQSWLVGTGVSCAVYVGLCYLSPPPGMNRHFVEVDESKGEVRFMDGGADEGDRSGSVEQTDESDEKAVEAANGSKEKSSAQSQAYVMAA